MLGNRASHSHGTTAQARDADAEEARVEAAIEGDFDRLIQNIREAGDGTSSGMLSKMWDMNLEEREAEFKDDLRAASGVGRSKKKVRSNDLNGCYYWSDWKAHSVEGGAVLSFLNKFGHSSEREIKHMSMQISRRQYASCRKSFALSPAPPQRGAFSRNATMTWVSVARPFSSG